MSREQDERYGHTVGLLINFSRSNTMGIEAIEIEDIKVLKNISKRCLSESIVLEDEERRLLIEHTASNIKEYSEKNECIFQKFVKDQTVSGYILIKQFWNLSDLFVLPEYQGIGIGRKLLSSAMAQAEIRGKGEEIWVNSSLNAEHFYRKMGFQDRIGGIKKPNNVVPLKYLFQPNKPSESS